MMSYVRTRILAPFLLLAACSSEPEPAESLPPARSVIVTAWLVRLDPNVPNWEANAIRAAGDDWLVNVDPVCPMSLAFETAETGAPPYGRIDVRMGDPAVISGNPEAIGWTWTDDPWSGTTITLKPDIDHADFGRVARHELGHALNLPHDDGGPGVMMSAGFVETVTSRDAASYAAMWCRP